MRYITALLFCLLSGEAFGQAAVQQYGTVTPYDLPRWARDHQIEDAGGLQGKNGQGVNPFSITDKSGLGICFNTDLTTKPSYYQFCLGHEQDGDALMTVDAIGGATPKSLHVRINGTTYDFLQGGGGGGGGGTGNVNGPVASVVGNAAVWNNTTGTLLKDAGRPPVLGPATTVSGNVVVWDSSTGTFVKDSGAPPLLAMPGGTVSYYVWDTAALRTVPTTATPIITRITSVAGSPGPLVTYVASGSACINGGANGDGGSQIKSADNKCWYAVLEGMKPTPMIWGCKGDGVTDDTVCFQSAMWATGSGKLYSGHGMYKLMATVTTAQGGFEFVCDNKNPFGLRAGVANLDPLFQLNGDNQALRNCFIDMSNNGTIANSSGTAVQMGNWSNAVVEENNIYGACIGIDVNGNVPHVYRNRVTSRDAGSLSSCIGIRVGALTTHANTTDAHLEYNTVETWGTARYYTNLAIVDAGGMTLGYNDFLGAQVGTMIVPGANQAVVWLTATGTYLGDTNSTTALYIAPGAPSASIAGLSFNQTWTSSSLNGAGVIIENPNGGNLRGIYFNGHRSFNNWTDGFTINAGTNITIDNSQICNNSENGPSMGHGIHLGVNVSDVKMRGNLIGSLCSGGPANAHHGYQIALDGNNNNLMIVGNELTDSLAAGPIGGQPKQRSIVENNAGIDDTSGPTIASASVIVLDAVFPRWHVTGTTPILNINNPWNGRQVYFISDGGALAFNTGGPTPTSICNNFTTAGFGAVAIAAYDSAAACWRMH